MSHKTAPFRAHVLCGNRNSGAQPISVNRQPCFCRMQWYDRELIVLVRHTERLSRSPCSLWERVFNRYPSTVNRDFCLIQWYDRAHCFRYVTQNGAPRESVLCGNRSSTVIRQPSTVFMRQPGLQPAMDPELCLSPIVFERDNNYQPPLLLLLRCHVCTTCQYQVISELIATVLAWSHDSELPVSRIATFIVLA